MVCRAQQAQSYTLNGNQVGKKISSGGRAGSSSHDQMPNSANHSRVNTRVRSIPPRSRMNSRAVRMCDASGGSPASRRAA